MARRKGLTVSQGVIGDRAAVERLYERESGRVFAYCYARLGSRSLAEWAVGATFDRVRGQAANGGLPDHELDWLLRTADKFCGPRLKLGADEVTGDGALVLGDWNGASFDQIAADLDAHQARLEAARQELSPWRRLLGALGIAPGGGWLQGALGGATAIKATAAVIAVAGAVVVVGTPVGDKLHHAVVPPDKHHVPAVTPTAVVAAPVSSGVPAATTPQQQGRGGPSTSTPRRPKQPKPGSPGGTGLAAVPAGTPQPASGSGGAPATTSSGISGGASVQTTPTVRPSSPTVTAPGVTVPQVSTPSVTTAPKPTVDTPTVSTPTAPTPTVSTPTVSTPTVPTPTVSTPTVTAPTVTAPTVTATVSTVTVTTPKLP